LFSAAVKAVFCPEKIVERGGWVVKTMVSSVKEWTQEYVSEEKRVTS